MLTFRERGFVASITTMLRAWQTVLGVVDSSGDILLFERASNHNLHRSLAFGLLVLISESR
jgi:hypothetical protein